MLANYLEKHQQSCYFKSEFGVECLGCGTQRACIELLRGNFVQSFQHQPSVILFILFSIGIVFFWKSNHLFLRKYIIYGFVVIACSMITRFTYNFFYDLV